MTRIRLAAALLAVLTVFERGKGIEQFAFRNTDAGPVLIGYHINSNELITN